jgi:hypothetical protein
LLLSRTFHNDARGADLQSAAIRRELFMRSRRNVAGVWLSVAALAMLGCNGLNSCAGTSGGASAAEPAIDVAKASVTKGPDASCDLCRQRACTDVSEDHIDLVAGCFSKPDPKLTAHPDPQFPRDCKAVVDCAFKHDCAYDPAKGVEHCYCGSRAVDECLTEGPADDAPCVAEWEAATRSKKVSVVLERMSDSEYPSGWAVNLLQCDRDSCGPRSEIGRCTP